MRWLGIIQKYESPKAEAFGRQGKE